MPDADARSDSSPERSGRGGLSQSRLVRGAVALAVVMLAGAVIAAWWWNQRPKVSEDEVKQAVVATLQREAPSSFLVTGELQTTVTSTITNSKILLPDMLNFNVGTTETTARVPGVVHYGFDVRELRPEDIEVTPGADTVTVRLPALTVQSVEPNLQRMEIRTRSGWARMYDESRTRTRDDALRVAQKALRQQGERHLDDSDQPRYNTARAVETMLTPVLKATGVRSPVVLFRLEGEGPGDEAPYVREPTG